MRKIACAIFFLISLWPLSVTAETKVVEIHIRYLSPGGEPNTRVEDLARNLIDHAEKELGDIVGSLGRLEWEIASIEPWDPPNLITYEVLAETATVQTIDYRSILGQLTSPNSRVPSNLLYLVLVPGFIGALDPISGESYTAVGAADYVSGYKMVLGEFGRRNFQAMISSFLHEFGHVIGIPDAYGEDCHNKLNVMCPNTPAREQNPELTKRYREAVRAYWLINAKPKSPGV